jgi:hypothetical protein
MIENNYIEIIEKIIIITCFDEKNRGPGFAWKHEGETRAI